MISLPSPVTIPVKTATIPLNPKVIFIDDGTKVGARIEGLKALILWDGDAYKAIGDWTQAQAEARIMELLGSNPASVLATLVPAIQT